MTDPKPPINPRPKKVTYGQKGEKRGVSKATQARNQPGFVPRGQRDGVPNTPSGDESTDQPIPGVGDVFSAYAATFSGAPGTQTPEQLAARAEMEKQYQAAQANIGQFGDYQKGGMVGKFNERWAALTQKERIQRAKAAGYDNARDYAADQRIGLRNVMELKNSEWNPLDVATFGNSPLITDPVRLAKLQKFINSVGVKNVKDWFDAKDAQDVLLARQLGLPFADKLAKEFNAIQASNQAAVDTVHQQQNDAAYNALNPGLRSFYVAGETLQQTQQRYAQGATPEKSYTPSTGGSDDPNTPVDESQLPGPSTTTGTGGSQLQRPDGRNHPDDRNQGDTADTQGIYTPYIFQPAGQGFHAPTAFGQVANGIANTYAMAISAGDPTSARAANDALKQHSEFVQTFNDLNAVTQPTPPQVDHFSRDELAQNY